MYGLDEETYKQPLPTRCDVHQGTTNLTFLKKMKNTDSLMGAKFKSKTHLLNTFFFILGTVFGAFGFKVRKKY